MCEVIKSVFDWVEDECDFVIELLYVVVLLVVVEVLKFEIGWVIVIDVVMVCVVCELVLVVNVEFSLVCVLIDKIDSLIDLVGELVII